MPNKYKQSVVSGKTRLNNSPISELEFSTIHDVATTLTTFNAGDIVPIACWEVLPHATFKVNEDFIIRQTTCVAPVMGQLVADFYAFFVPNRVVNHSWKNVMGENTSGSWSAPEVSLAPLGDIESGVDIRIPIGSVADYYGMPTQYPIKNAILTQMHDLKFRGYLEIYNQYFRSQAYQPPIPYSKLNVYNGFLESRDSEITLYGADYGDDDHNTIFSDQVSDGSFGAGAVQKAIGGDGSQALDDNFLSLRRTAWSALDVPLKANKLHDWFTSVLPTPQKSDRQVVVPVLGQVPLSTSETYSTFDGQPLNFRSSNSMTTGFHDLFAYASGINLTVTAGNSTTSSANTSNTTGVNGVNLVADLDKGNVAVSVDDLRLSSSIQRVYELLGRGGSRYREFVNSFFNLEVDDPFDDVPRLLGHFRRDLDLYQTAQTSATADGSSPQGNLTAFGYTNNGGDFFHEMFFEHGYIHIFCVVRHKNVYSTYLAPDNFRLSLLDFYTPQLANISEQPVRTRCINPFTISGIDGVFGYNEAWSEYRYLVDNVTGQMRPQTSNYADQSLDVWNYADDVDNTIVHCDRDWLKSNTDSVVERSTAMTERDKPQFKGQFIFDVTMELPMPTYSVPGNDIF